MDNQLEPNEGGAVNPMASHEDYEKTFKTIKRGDYLTGTVVKIDDNGIFVDVGYKQEGFIPMNQFSHKPVDDIKEMVNVGDEIPVVVLKCGDIEGDLILSKKRADLEAAWRKVTDAFKSGNVVTATVVEAVKGGLLVDLGLRGFVPASHVDLRPVKDLNDYVGEALKLKVIELDRARRKVVLSRKRVLEEERLKMKEETLNSLYEGQIVRGNIARLTNFGAFVNLGGVDGLVHISEISWKRIKHPADVLTTNADVDVLVLKVDKDRERISLSIRQATPDPWHTIDEIVKPNTVIRGRVTKIAKKYVFVEIKEGVEGVIPMHELSHKRFGKASEVVKEGQEIDVKVLDLKKNARRMVLSFKQAGGGGTVSDVKKYTSSGPGKSSGERATIGDILRAKMKEEKKEEAQQAEQQEKAEKVEEPKAETPKEEPVKVEEPKAETPKEEPVKVEEPKAETPKEEPAKVEEPKAKEEKKNEYQVVAEKASSQE